MSLRRNHLLDVVCSFLRDSWQIFKKFCTYSRSFAYTSWNLFFFYHACGSFVSWAGLWLLGISVPLYRPHEFSIILIFFFFWYVCACTNLVFLSFKMKMTGNLLGAFKVLKILSHALPCKRRLQQTSHVTSLLLGIIRNWGKSDSVF